MIVGVAVGVAVGNGELMITGEYATGDGDSTLAAGVTVGVTTGLVTAGVATGLVTAGVGVGVGAAGALTGVTTGVVGVGVAVATGE